jgi:hypothetical protein
MEGSVLELRDSMPPWLVGACINVLGSIFINLGTNLVKLSHMKAELVDGHKDRKKWFTVGMAIFVCGNILNFISMVCYVDHDAPQNCTVEWSLSCTKAIQSTRCFDSRLGVFFSLSKASVRGSRK